MSGLCRDCKWWTPEETPESYRHECQRVWQDDTKAEAIEFEHYGDTLNHHLITASDFGCVQFVQRKNCEGCGEEFGAANAKQRYCTPACASTKRWRRWKARQSALREATETSE
jgi:hypothetical protein